MHIKIINGRKYYYESIRRGKKVTSRYIKPVERIRKRRILEEEANEADLTIPEDSYIG